MIRCDKVRRQLADHSVGRLRGRARARVEQHVRQCEACRAELAALQRTGALLDGLGKQPVPAGMWESVRRRIERPARAPVRRPRLVVGAVGLAVLSLIVVGVFLLLPTGTSAPPEIVVTAEADAEMQAVIDGHASAIWSAPLADEAAVGLRFVSLEDGG